LRGTLSIWLRDSSAMWGAAPWHEHKKSCPYVTEQTDWEQVRQWTEPQRTEKWTEPQQWIEPQQWTEPQRTEKWTEPQQWIEPQQWTEPQRTEKWTEPQQWTEPQRTEKWTDYDYMQPPKGKVNTVCTYYNNGACRNGEECRYVHVKLGRELPHPKAKTETCRHFHKSYGCKLGDGCQFIHFKVRGGVRRACLETVERPARCRLHARTKNTPQCLDFCGTGEEKLLEVSSMFGRALFFSWEVVGDIEKDIKLATIAKKKNAEVHEAKLSDVLFLVTSRALAVCERGGARARR
jgi:hypothetical protein